MTVLYPGEDLSYHSRTHSSLCEKKGLCAWRERSRPKCAGWYILSWMAGPGCPAELSYGAGWAWSYMTRGPGSLDLQVATITLFSGPHSAPAPHWWRWGRLSLSTSCCASMSSVEFCNDSDQAPIRKPQSLPGPSCCCFCLLDLLLCDQAHPCVCTGLHAG